jgi:ribosomal-protein-serine acetyltransferase
MLKFKNKLIGKRILLKALIFDIELAKTIFETTQKNRKHLEQWLPWVEETIKPEDTLNYLLDSVKGRSENKKINYGIFINDEHIGNIGVFDIDEENQSGEIGYWLSKDFTQKGYMTEAVHIIEKEFFETHNFNRLQIQCDQRNQGSSGVAKKSCFILEGVLRQNEYSKYHKDFANTLVFSKLKSEYLTNLKE